MECQKYVAHFKQIKTIVFSFFTNKKWTCIIHCHKALLFLSRYASDT